MWELCEMVTYTKTKAKHPRTILKAYRMFLMDYEDEEILKAEIPAVDLLKCRQFNQSMLEGRTFYGSGKAIRISEHISKNMQAMYEQWRAGAEITFGVPSREKCPHIVSAYMLILTGANESEMRETCTEFEIEKAKLFSQIANSDKLYSTTVSYT